MGAYRPTYARFGLRRIAALMLGGMILIGWAGAEARAQNRNTIEEEFRRKALQDLQACIKDEKIDPPQPPRTKLEKCEDILGVDKDGNQIPCHVVANGSCEVQ